MDSERPTRAAGLVFCSLVFLLLPMAFETLSLGLGFLLATAEG